MGGNIYLNPFLPYPNCLESYSLGNSTGLPCEDFARKLISLRVYFILIIVNFVFITTTSAYYIYRIHSARHFVPPWAISSMTNRQASKQWQIYSLKRRSLFGSMLMVIGYLILSTAILLCQTIVTPYTCSVHLWCPMIGLYIWMYGVIWRTIRFHLMFRMNEQQEQYHVKNKALYCTNSIPISMIGLPNGTSSNNKSEDKEYKWLMHHKKALKLGMSHHVIVFGIFLFALGIIVALAETLGVSTKYGTSRCTYDMGNFVMMGMVIFFFFFVAPFIIWHLRNDKDDTHGVRKDIVVTVVTACICLLVCIIWLSVVEGEFDLRAPFMKCAFSPLNFVIIDAAACHVVSIILPLFKTLSLDKDRNNFFVKSKNYIHNLFQKKAKYCNESIGPVLPLSATHIWEVTTDCLHQALCDPTTLQILKNWALKDLSVENVLFYDRYMHIIQRLESTAYCKLVSQTICITPTKKSTDPRHQHYVIPDLCSNPTDIILSLPLRSDLLVPEVLDFYNTFIVEGAPLQVNITHTARYAIDVKLSPLAKKFQMDIYQRKHNVFNTIANKPFLFFPPIEEDISLASALHHTGDNESLGLSRLTSVYEESSSIYKFSDMRLEGITPSTTNVTLQLFEQARTEVFNNIYTGVFPKIVEAYKGKRPDD